MTPIHYASRYGNSSCIRALIDAGANPNTKTSNNLTPLSIAEDNMEDHENVTEVLRRSGGYNVLDWDRAIQNRSIKKAKTFLLSVPEDQKTEIVNRSIIEGRTALHISCQMECPEMMEFLFENGSRWDCKDIFGILIFIYS